MPPADENGTFRNVFNFQVLPAQTLGRWPRPYDSARQSMQFLVFTV